MTLTERYDRAAPNWGAKLSELGYAAAYRDLFSQKPPRTVGRVCDVGTGSGAFAGALCQAVGPVAELTLLDPSEQMLKRAQSALRGQAHRLFPVQATLDDAPDSPQFDTVLAAHMVEHCADPAAAIARLYALCAPGGQTIMVISKPHICQWVIWLKWRHKWWPAKDIINIARDVGFDRVETVAFPNGVPARTSLAYICHKA